MGAGISGPKPENEKSGTKYIFENQDRLRSGPTDFKVLTELSPDLAMRGSLAFGQRDGTSFRTFPIINSNGRVIVFALIDGVSHLNVSNGTSFRIERK